EQLLVASALSFAAEQSGMENELVQKILAGKSPHERAAELVQGSKLKDVKVRKELYEGGKPSVDASTDSMIAFAKLIDGPARAVRKIMDTEVDDVKRQAYGQIAKAKFAVEGTNTYPDATFTLRLSFGPVKGYTENGKPISHQTDISGLYERSKEHDDKPPFD